MKTELQEVSLPDDAQITVFRLVQESLTNVAKYARATQVTVTLQPKGDEAYLAVRVDGGGFDLRRVGRDTHGLRGMRFRVEAAGGRMAVETAPGEGTVIRAWLPVRAPAPAGAQR